MRSSASAGLAFIIDDATTLRHGIYLRRAADIISRQMIRLARAVASCCPKITSELNIAASLPRKYFVSSRHLFCDY